MWYTEVKRTDRMLQVTWLFLTNQSALFQCSYSVLQFAYDFGPMFIFLDC